ncbi:Cellulose synthase A catalytic subunit 9 [UDP-forming] [Dendrobium catenatum]|uniref:Cellulose synthase A catalytic subunit 9 [UDP-forming] n=1 Tax=Dendrobium catenatum TaxID=906689 RepID=A0A2I0WS29_9ASPA|nr:Cellulose synthase A catalytic subunit 9 [UDP-forming] [Dendrobium catenatum]
MVSCDCCPSLGKRKKPRFDINDSELPVDVGVNEDKQVLMSQMNLDKRFGKYAFFVISTLIEQGGVPPSSSAEALLKVAIHIISCDDEDKIEWGL